jgi:hypothetical protein
MSPATTTPASTTTITTNCTFTGTTKTFMTTDVTISMTATDTITVLTTSTDTTMLTKTSRTTVTTTYLYFTFITEFILRSDKDSKEFRFDSESLRIKAIASLTDSSRLNFEYKDSLLTVIRHSDGPYVSVRYNVNKQIQYMQLHESTPGSVSQV